MGAPKSARAAGGDGEGEGGLSAQSEASCCIEVSGGTMSACSLCSGARAEAAPRARDYRGGAAHASVGGEGAREAPPSHAGLSG